MKLEPATISEHHLEKIQSLESELDTVLLAVEKPREFASLSDEQLQELKKTETSLGCVVLAYADSD